MEVQVNMVAVLLATVVSMVVGFVWYAKPVFGRMWAKLAGVKEDQMTSGDWKPMVLTLLVSFITAYVLAHVTYLSNSFFKNDFLYDALMTAFWVWLGFTAARFITHDAFEGRRKKLTLLNISFELVTLLAMALVIGVMKP